MSTISSDFVNTRASPHRAELEAFLQRQFSTQNWEFAQPHARGKETYFASGGGQIYFIKLAVPIANYQVMAALGLTPPVLAADKLEDGTPVLVQLYIECKTPSRADFRLHLAEFASAIRTMQHCAQLREVLPEAGSEQHCDLASQALKQLRIKWDRYKPQLPGCIEEVEEKLNQLEQKIDTLESSGVVAAHKDICNANWLITADGRIYLVDLDSMAMDDPACDLGAILWWYYPPDIRPHFLHAAGYINSEQFQTRMRLRMSLHCLDIMLPREGSYDQLDVENFEQCLQDFRAIIAGRENPQGYDG